VGNRWYWLIGFVLVFVGQVALAQLETVADLNFGTGYIQPGQTQVTQKVALVDSDDNTTRYHD
jgi:hypothetical protein